VRITGLEGEKPYSLPDRESRIRALERFKYTIAEFSLFGAAAWASPASGAAWAALPRLVQRYIKYV